MYKVFLSSTSRDLEAYREAVQRAVDGLPGFILVRMEHFGARDANAKDLCERLVRECDLLVGLLGHYYGSCPPGETTSFTEVEYRTAKAAGLSRLTFVAPPHFPIPADLRESDASFEKQQRFRQEVMGERVVASFETAEQLASAITQALFIWHENQRQAEARNTTHRVEHVSSALPATSDEIPDAFLSYTHFDDQHDGGAISQFRTRLANAVRAVTGEPFKIFRDVDGIGLGGHWPGKLDQMLDKARFFMPIITPSYFASKSCREELGKFIHAEAERGRVDLILPIYYIRCRVLEEEDLRRKDPLAQIIHQRQRWDWRAQRIRTFRNRNVRLSIEALAWEIEKVRRRADASKHPAAAVQQAARPTPSAERETEQVSARPRERAEPGLIFRDIDAPWCPEMVVIPSGELVMDPPCNDSEANDPKQPQHLVRIGYPLAVGRYPVTFREYDYFCEATRRQRPSDQGRGRGPQPVINVSWKDAKAYTAWLSEETGKVYRLPRETEWEYAARAGIKAPWVTDPRIRGYLWTEEDNRRTPAIPIDVLTPHPWGILGVYSEGAGIWEWCEDSWHELGPIRSSVRTDDSYSRRVARCFGWLDEPPWLGTLARFGFDECRPHDFCGFRVIRALAH